MARSPDSVPPPRPLQRPWYLMAALVAAWIYGAQILGGGWEVVSFFRGDRPDIAERANELPSAEVRAVAIAAGEHWLQVREAASRRELPFGVASLILGAAMVLLAARSLAGREGSRRALIQVVAVHAGVLVAAFFCTQDVAQAEVAYHIGEVPALSARSNDPLPWQAKRALATVLQRAVPPVALLMEMSFASLIVIALTRPRARAFFREATPGPLGEG